jgi:hypothetical protein
MPVGVRTEPHTSRPALSLDFMLAPHPRTHRCPSANEVRFIVWELPERVLDLYSCPENLDTSHSHSEKKRGRTCRTHRAACQQRKTLEEISAFHGVGVARGMNAARCRRRRSSS